MWCRKSIWTTIAVLAAAFGSPLLGQTASPVFISGNAADSSGDWHENRRTDSESWRY